MYRRIHARLRDRQRPAGTAEDGVNVYADDGYVEPGWQVVAGGQYMFLTDELAYQTLDQFEIVDDGLDLDAPDRRDGASIPAPSCNGMDCADWPS